MSLLVAQYHTPFAEKVGGGNRNFKVLRRYLKAEIFHKIWGSLFAETTHCGPLGDHICYQKLFQPSLHILGRLWNTLSTIDTSYCSTAAHFLCWEGAQNLKFASKLMFVIGRNDIWNDMLCTLRDSYRLPVALPTILIYFRNGIK